MDVVNNGIRQVINIATFIGSIEYKTVLQMNVCTSTPLASTTDPWITGRLGLGDSLNGLVD